LLALTSGGRAVGASTDAATPGCPDVLLDGAHNPAGTAALAAAVDELRPLLSGGRPTLLIGLLRDKDIAGMLAPLRASRLLTDAHVITTTVPGTDRSLEAAALAAAWGSGADAVSDAGDAVAAAAAQALTSDGPLIACGSLYLVGHIRRQLLED
ncbi:MAG: bifunctional folylpolyglutamate synthase/dihydrofolate synthase, partial [Chloroflexota bacterium]|nr:bifunctional folylpolyglutamate synthase/dihydrofolate synthase [Chloroflexota bacterium]